MIAVEFGWLGFLDIMWLASAAYTTSIWPPLGALCSLNPNISNLDGACVDVQTSMAFGWLNWIVLTAYLVLLFVFCIVSANRGRLVWTSTVKTANWASGKGYSAPPMQHQVQPSAGYGAPRIQYQMQAPTGYTAKQYDPTD
ncbi:hypothetical protein PsYK624_086210 [Phanerochaete sordida]|uniref:MARVEL domain-containing protein n=1 Tax=Phanerochaete sordida TaxID=48140 RepID=A0A9P3GB02_9APHY|nr:hypothetical protein PsYK624_086210 [Phanerochaete sordida]